ncbi:hypothetical protein E1A91_D08G099700v1 [Gossypium mustelinum]|uniref:BZIP domain-containing protein n=1 Tax=Gossypium mustelinum TaxID=34275 RepID=A0A5D2TU31_GOSMU|nr:hypothetical protein E1A91_D08G099700v1 [Gossypium mustelinum]
MEEINWDTFFLEVTKPPLQPCSTQNPDEEPTLSSWIEEIEKVLIEDDNFDHMVETQLTHTDVDKDNPIAKKQKRQLRNRDAVVRSRERKKMYVKDLEMKSRYLEGECRRLSHVLHC